MTEKISQDSQPIPSAAPLEREIDWHERALGLRAVALHRTAQVRCRVPRAPACALRKASVYAVQGTEPLTQNFRKLSMPVRPGP